MLDPDRQARIERRAQARTARRRRRVRLAAGAALLATLLVLAVLLGAGGSSRRSGTPAPRLAAARARPQGTAARTRADAVVPGGPLAPAWAGGLAALWAPGNVVGASAGTAAAYAAASRLVGLPGFLLIADRGNNRILVVGRHGEIVFEFPNAADLAAGRRLVFNDDTFVVPGGAALIANEEENHAIVSVGIATHSLTVLFGHPGQVGGDSTHLNFPDDAYALPDGSFTVADAYNCRILFIAHHTIIRQYGYSGDCHHDPPRTFGPVNGDTPLPGGGVLVSEIPGSWIDELGPDGRLRFAFQAPVGYPSDPQPLPGGRILLADYSNPGHVLITDDRGRVLWSYGPSAGSGRLDHPSLAMALPNGDIAVNDDFRDRVVVIDPRLRRIVWQYGHTDRPGTAPGYLNTPDGMDFVPAVPDPSTYLALPPDGLPDWSAVVHP
jgi:hypothetical protein